MSSAFPASFSGNGGQRSSGSAVSPPRPTTHFDIAAPTPSRPRRLSELQDQLEEQRLALERVKRASGAFLVERASAPRPAARASTTSENIKADAEFVSAAFGDSYRKEPEERIDGQHFRVHESAARTTGAQSASLARNTGAPEQVKKARQAVDFNLPRGSLKSTGSPTTHRAFPTWMERESEEEGEDDDCCTRFRKKLSRFVKHPMFETVILLLILVDLFVVLSSEQSSHEFQFKSHHGYGKQTLIVGYDEANDVLFMEPPTYHPPAGGTSGGHSSFSFLETEERTGVLAATSILVQDGGIAGSSGGHGVPFRVQADVEKRAGSETSASTDEAMTVEEKMGLVVEDLSREQGNLPDSGGARRRRRTEAGGDDDDTAHRHQSSGFLEVNKVGEKKTGRTTTKLGRTATGTTKHQVSSGHHEKPSKAFISRAWKLNFITVVISKILLCIFMLEITLHIVAHGFKGHFLEGHGHWFTLVGHWIDAIVVPTSFVIEFFFEESMHAADLLIVLRLWRFVRILVGFYQSIAVVVDEQARCEKMIEITSQVNHFLSQKGLHDEFETYLEEHDEHQHGEEGDANAGSAKESALSVFRSLQKGSFRSGKADAE